MSVRNGAIVFALGSLLTACDRELTAPAGADTDVYVAGGWTTDRRSKRLYVYDPARATWTRRPTCLSQSTTRQAIRARSPVSSTSMPA